MSSRFSLGTNPKDEPNVDKDALQQFAAGANEHRTDQEPAPWKKYDADAVPTHNVSVRLNDRELEMLRYLAKKLDTSQQKILNRILIPAIEEKAQEIDEA